MNNSIILNYIKNITTNLDLLPKEPKPELEVTEFGNQTLFFQSSMAAAQGHLISVQGKICINKVVYDFKATGQIKKISLSVEDLKKFEIHMHQFDKSQWAEFIHALEKNQARVDDTFKKIKGQDHEP